MLYYLSQDLTCARECPVPCQTGLSQDLLTCARAYFRTAVFQKVIVQWKFQCATILTNHIRGSWGLFQANGRLSFEDDLRSGGLFYCVSQWTSVLTELADIMVTLGNDRMLKKSIWTVWYIQQLKALLASSSGICWWAQCRFPDKNRQTKVLCWWDDKPA